MSITRPMFSFFLSKSKIRIKTSEIFNKSAIQHCIISPLQTLVYPLSREGELKIICIKEGYICEYFFGRAINDNLPVFYHDAPFTDIEYKVKIMRGDDLCMLKSLEEINELPS